MRSLRFALIFAALFAIFAGIPTGHAALAFVSAFVVGLLVYAFLRFISMPFR